jgi:glycosyltransferase involved in cell wall biosynthesis
MKILLIGEEHVRGKAARHYQALHRQRGVVTHYYVDDRSGITRDTTQAEYGLNARYAPNPSGGPRALLRYLRGFVRYFREVRPDVLEVYTSIHPGALLPMMVYARAHRVPVVVVCRGELHPPHWAGQPTLVNAGITRMLRMADLVVYKEAYMPAVLDRLAPRTPRFGWTNAIPVHPARPLEREENRVLFLNFFKPWRNLELIIRAAPLVRAQVPDVRFDLVGGSSELSDASGFYSGLHDYERGLLRLMDELAVHDYVRILPFTAEVEEHYARAKTYLLPADLVYCNYALLEAMERGVPPIVTADVDEAARLIVDDGVNGLVVPLDPAAWADAVVRLLSDEPLRQRLGTAARATVLQRFDLSRQIDVLVDRYVELLRARRRPRPLAVGSPAQT